MQLEKIIQSCAEITQSKGFDISQHATQIALIATEVAEAMEHLTCSDQDEINNFYEDFLRLCEELEAYRKNATAHHDNSEVFNQQALNEELADVCIRVFSYIGGNGQCTQFLQTLTDKIEKNAKRPILHGKCF